MAAPEQDVPPIHPEDSTFMGSIFNDSPPNSSSHRTSSSHLSARDILNDLDYESYLSEPSPSSTDVIRQISERAIWKYSSVFLAQPFDVAKTILQVQYNGLRQIGGSRTSKAKNARRRDERYRRYTEEEISSDSDPESYFSPATPSSRPTARKPRSRRRRGSSSSYGYPSIHTPRSPPHSSSSQAPHALDLKSSSSLIAVLTATWNKEGPWGVWKGTNSTYVYSILLSTLTSFSRSFLAAVLSLPDPGLSSQLSALSSPPSSLDLGSATGIDILSSETPLLSLAVAVSAAGIASLILSPLDIARTKLILTPSTHPPRSVFSALTSLSSWTVPISIAPITLLHSIIPSFISSSLPLFLRRNLRLDPLTNSNFYSVGTCAGQALELAIKLPLETVLRRGQTHVIQSSSSSLLHEESYPSLTSIVEIGGYNGVFGTMYDIVYNEGERAVIAKPTSAVKQGVAGGSQQQQRAPPTKQIKKGQGFEGLWRGWRVGMWGLVGLWGAKGMGNYNGGKGGEF